MSSSIIEDFPVTTILALVGLMIGLLAPSPFHDFIVNFSFENVTQDPAGTLTGYVIGMPIAMIGEVFVKLITSLMFGLIAGVIGLFVDIIKNSECFTEL
jgi:hypothetical protein